MFGWTRIFTLVAVAAAVAIVAGGAGATPTSALAPATVAHATSSGKVSTAASRSGTLLKTANLSTRAGVVRYLRAIGLDPHGLVIQRGARNYAGPNCPGAGWACTSTAHPVVQIAAAGGRNTFFCTTGSCAVVQATTSGTATKTTRPLTAAAAPNKATCNKTSGLTQSCSITQTSATVDNVAIVVERAQQASSVNQTVSSTVSAQITQQASGLNKNQACVYQNITETLTPTNAKKGVPVNVTLEGHQSVVITQDAASGDNTVQNAAAPPATAACVSGPLTQTQTLTSRATGTVAITQSENAANGGPNISLDIKQNQTAPYFGSATGLNNAAFSQTNALTAIANTRAGPVSQTQSSPTGGIQASVNQFSHGISTATATQSERQCAHAQTSGSPTCTAGSPPSYSLTQVQYGPVKNTAGKSPTAASRSFAFVRKDPGSTQGDNSQDTFTINQGSTQSNDTGQDQTNEVQGACTTSGNCTVSQTTTVNGETTTNTQSGQNVDTTTSCTGSTCTPTAPPAPVIDSGPTQPSTTSTDATFAFHDADTSATFQCKLETDLTYTPCTSPKSYTGLPDGQHTFSVEAVNPSNGTVSDPATYTWTITTANTDLMTNGSFEADPFDYNGTFDLGSSNPLTGWTTSTSGLYPWGLPYPNTYNAGPTPYGNQWVIVGNECDQGISWIEQTINTTVGQTYTLSFALASEEGGSGAQVEVSFPTGSSTTSQTFTAPPRVTNFWDTWATSSMDFTADSASATIRFTSVPVSVSEGCDAGIDNVAVTAAQTIG